jgi:gliding motility-associated-like protein
MVTVNVNTGTAPEFTPVNYVCQYDPVTTLPFVSNNGVSGIWTPSFSAATPGTTVYTFTPNSGQCATSTTMSITVLGAQRIAPLGAQCSVADLNFEALPNPGPSGVSYAWLVTPPPGITVNVDSGNGQIFSTQATNNSNIPLTFTSPNTISVTITIDGVTCVKTFSPTVNPVPFIGNETVSICNGEPFNITPSTGAPNLIPTGTTYTWIVDDNLNVSGESAVSIGQTSISQTLTTASPGSQQVLYTVTPTSGDAGTCVGPPFTISVNVLSEVLPLFDQIAPLCTGDVPPTLVSTSLNGISGSWSPSLVSTAFVGSQIYTFTPDPNSCATTATMTIIINANPVVMSQDVSVCQNEVTVLNASGANTYSWTPNSGISANTGSAVNFAASQSTTYSITGTSAEGCTSTTQVTVTVNPLPPISAGPDQSACEGLDFTLSATGGLLYSWSNSVVNGVSFYPPLGDTDYTVTGTDENGCVNSDIVTLTVYPLPDVFAGNDVSVCDGSSVALSGSGATMYSWSDGISNGVLFFPVVGNSNYTLTGTSANGCIDTDEVVVTVHPNPEVSFVPDAVLGCAPFSTNLTNTTPDAVSCQWSISSGEIISGCGTIPVYFTEPGCYDIALTTTNTQQCSSTLLISDLICVEPPPIAQFSSNQTVLTVLDTEVEFYNESSGAVSYSWFFGSENDVSSDEHPVYLFPEEAGDYTVTLIAVSALGCTDTAFSTITVNDELLFYVPNTFTPDTDDYNPTFTPVFTSGFFPQEYTLYIFNRWGELIFESRDASIGWDGSYGTWSQSRNQVNLCEDGTYTWKIVFKSSSDNKRKIIMGHVNLIR